MSLRTKRAKELRNGDKVLVVSGGVVIVEPVKVDEGYKGGNVRIVAGGSDHVYYHDQEIVVVEPDEGGHHG